MATVNSTVTIDTGEWNYIDSTGIGHQVTNGQTFQLRIDDNGAADVRYYFAVGQTPITTTDGYTLTFRPLTENATNGTGNGNAYRMIAPLTDAGQGSNFYSLRGQLSVQCSSNGVVQNWVPATLAPSDADYGAAGTIGGVFEDQFGNRMTIAAGTTVGQAA
jgi:hypothetical protein